MYRLWSLISSWMIQFRAYFAILGVFCLVSNLLWLDSIKLPGNLILNYDILIWLLLTISHAILAVKAFHPGKFKQPKKTTWLNLCQRGNTIRLSASPFIYYNRVKRIISPHSTATRTVHLRGFVGIFQLVCSKLLAAKFSVFREKYVILVKQQVPFSTRDCG